MNHTVRGHKECCGIFIARYQGNLESGMEGTEHSVVFVLSNLVFHAGEWDNLTYFLDIKYFKLI